MYFIKKNFKIIMAFIMGIILTGSVVIFASVSYTADQVRYEKNGNLIPLDEALDDLYSIANDRNIVLAGHGEIEYSSTITTETAIPSTVDDSNILQVSNNIFTIKKNGKYLIVGVTGCKDEDNMLSYKNDSQIKLLINNSYITKSNETDYFVSASQAGFDINYNIVNLNQSDTIALKYNGYGNKTSNIYNLDKIALFYIYYVK